MAREICGDFFRFVVESVLQPTRNNVCAMSDFRGDDRIRCVEFFRYVIEDIVQPLRGKLCDEPYVLEAFMFLVLFIFMALLARR